MGLEPRLELYMEPEGESSPVLKFNSELVDFFVGLGPRVSISVEECRTAIASLSPHKFTPAGVARILNRMILNCHEAEASAQTSSQPPPIQTNSIWGETPPNSNDNPTGGEYVPWNGKVFVQALLELHPNFIWKEVFHELDFPGFVIRDGNSFRSLLESLRHGLNLQGQTRPDQYPVEAIYRKWNNSEGQLSLIKQCLNPSNFDVFCFADVPFHSCSVEILKMSGDKSYDLKEICMWKSMELVELLLHMSDAGFYPTIQELFQFPVSQSPDILILCLIQLNTPMNMLRQELLNKLFPIFLGSHVNSGVILQHAWHAGQPTIRPIMTLAMSEWYLLSDYDQARLSRILDVAQDLKALPLLLNATSHIFIIDLACLASRREFLKLDKWLTDKTREHGESFVKSLVQVLHRRVPLLLNKDESSKSPQPTDAIAAMIQCLRQCVGKLPPDLNEEVANVVTNCSSTLTKVQAAQARMPPPSTLPGIGSNPQTSGPPVILRSHRSMEPNYISSPTSSQIFSTPNNDPLGGISSSLAGLNLAGTGGFGSNPLAGLGNNTPGSPSRNLPNFNSQQHPNNNPGLNNMLSGLQLQQGSVQHNNNGGLQGRGPGNVGNSAESAGGILMGLRNSLGMSGRSLPPTGPPPPNILHNTAGFLNATTESYLRDPSKIFTEFAPSEISKEAQDEANGYFHRIYSKSPDPTMSVDEVLELLKRFQESSIRREREIFVFMLRNLFAEYKFFPQYPEKELHTTAQLFGGILEYGLISTFLQLGVALRFVVDALKNAPGCKMYYFGLTALDRFKLKLKEYPQYCQHLASIPHIQELPPHLMEFIEFGSRSQDPPSLRHRVGALALPPAGAGTTSSILPLPQLPSSVSAPGQGKPPGSVSASALANATLTSGGGPSIGSRPSIATSTNIQTLLDASSATDKINLPPESIQDRTAFIFNNLNQMNLADKSKEFQEVVGTNYWNWVAQYLVMKRASIELNFHSLYSNLLDTLKQQELNLAVVKETHRNIRILLRSDKSAGNFSDRALLKNLGHWLGMITLMKNNPIILDDLDIKSLLVEACRRGLKDLLYVVPFAAKVMESCARSEVFKPQTPYTMGILCVLKELHKEPEMKLNLKFEIEVLYKALNVDINEIKASDLLRDEGKYKVWVSQLSFPTSGEGKELALPTKPPRQQASDAINIQPQQAIGRPPQIMSGQELPAAHHQQSSSLGSTPQPGLEELTGGSQLSIPQRPSSAVGISSGFTQMQQSIGGPVIGGLSSNSSPGIALEPKFSYIEVDTANLAALLSHVSINNSLPLFQTHPTLKQFVRPAVEKSIQDLLIPVVDRSIKYTINACESIIKKDFALDPEENRVRMGAHHMMRYLTAGMAMITSRDHIFIAISGNLKTAFLASIRAPSANQQIKEQIDQASSTIAQENMELVCVFIQKTAIEKALEEIDKRLASDFEIRKQAKLEGRRYCDPVMLAYQMERIPEPIRIRTSGAMTQQLAVYEDFSRNIPGFLPPSEGEIPFINQKLLMQGMAGMNMPSTSATTLPMVAQSPAGSAPGGSEELMAIYDKLIHEMDNCLQGLALNRSPASAQLITGVRSLAELIVVAKSTRSIVAAITLLQKSVEGLLDGLSGFPSDPEVIRFRDAHLMVLKALQDPRAYGSEWVIRQVTKTMIEARSDVKYNVEAVDTLIRASLVNMHQFDVYLSNAIENGNNLMATHFAMQLVQMYLVDERFQSGVTETDLYQTVDTLSRCLAINRQHPDGLVQLIDMLRSQVNQDNNVPIVPNFALEQRTLPPVSSTTHQLQTGITQSREFDDPSGLAEKSELLLKEWIRLYVFHGSPKDSNKAFSSFIHDLNASGILKSDDVITRFFRISVQCCVSQVYQGLQNGSMAIARGKVYQSTDAFVRLVSLLVRHIGDNVSTTPKINLLNKFLGIVAGLLVQDHDAQKTNFRQLPFHRLFIMLFYDLNNNDPVFESISMQILTGFSNTLHILCPSKVPGFAYAWLEIIGSRVYISRMLALASDQKCWAMYCQLLLDLFKFLTPFLRNADMVTSVQTLYRGTLRILLVILHDFPDFLCDYCYHFLDAIPPNCIQMRNLVLSAFPRNMRLPDPFTANLKFEMLAESSAPPRMLSNFGAQITPASFRKDLDSYLKSRAPVTFLSELRTNLQVLNEPGTRYNIPLLNALVLYVGNQHINVIRAKGQTPNISTVAHSSHMDIFQNLAVDLDTEGRYLFLNSLGNQLRFPSSHTHYFSLIILYLFGQSNTEVVQEQITRALLERLVVNRPHPWGLLVTFIELIKNDTYKFWDHPFVRCAPEVEKLFESVARSCMVAKSGVLGGQLGIGSLALSSNGSTMGTENSSSDPMMGGE